MAVIGVVERAVLDAGGKRRASGNLQDMELLRGLQGVFPEVRVLCATKGGAEERATDYGKTYPEFVRQLELLHLPGKGARWLLGWLSFLPKIAGFVRRCDVVFVYMPSTLGIVSTVTAMLRRKTVVSYYGSRWDESFPPTYREYLSGRRGTVERKRRVKTWLQDLSIRASELVLCRDPSFVRYCRDRGTRAEYVPGNTNFDLARDARSPERGGRGEIRILSVCEVLPRKGLHDALAAMRVLKGLGHRASLRVVGRGASENVEHLRGVARAEGVEESLSFVGEVKDPEVLRQEYDAADVFLLASYAEGLPRVVVEAQSRGLPVIATAVGGLADLMQNGREILLVAPGDPEGMARALAEVFENDDLRARLAEGGRQFVESETRRPRALEVLSSWWSDRTPGNGGRR